MKTPHPPNRDPMKSKRHPAFNTLWPKLLLCLLMAWHIGGSQAQTSTPAAQVPALKVVDTADFLSKLPPVEVLIDSAIAHAPAVKGQDISLRKTQLDIKHAKNLWTSDIVNAGGALNYGKLNDMYLSDNGTAGQVVTIPGLVVQA